MTLISFDILPIDSTSWPYAVVLASLAMTTLIAPADKSFYFSVVPPVKPNSPSIKIFLTVPLQSSGSKGITRDEAM